MISLTINFAMVQQFVVELCWLIQLLLQIVVCRQSQMMNDRDVYCSADCCGEEQAGWRLLRLELRCRLAELEPGELLGKRAICEA